MRVIIAGSRNFTEYNHVQDAVDMCRWYIKEIVSGGARGIDTLAKDFAFNNIMDFKEFQADWNNLGTSAGFVRNCQMADYSDGLIAIWDGESKGTKHMINIMLKQKKPTFVFFPK